MNTLFVLFVLACAPATDGFTEVCADRVMTTPVSERECADGRDALISAAQAEGIRVEMAICAPAVMEVRGHGW